MDEKYGEEWRVIPFAQDYEASNLGRIRSKASLKVMKAYPTASAMIVPLHINGVQKNRQVERCVWQAFHGLIQRTTRIKHKDGNIENNQLDNLEAEEPAFKRKKQHGGKGMNINKEEFVQALASRMAQKEPEPGSVAAEIAGDLKREKVAAASQTPVKETPEDVKAAVKETPETTRIGAGLRGTVHGPISAIWKMLHAAGCEDIEATVTFGSDR